MKKPLKPVSRVMAGDVLVASIIRQGNGRPASPVRWLLYWSPTAERMGSGPAVTCSCRQEAEAEAIAWACPRFAFLPRVERAR